MKIKNNKLNKEIFNNMLMKMMMKKNFFLMKIEIKNITKYFC